MSLSIGRVIQDMGISLSIGRAIYVGHGYQSLYW